MSKLCTRDTTTADLRRARMLTGPRDAYDSLAGLMTPESGLIELIDNAYDAGATRVMVCVGPHLIAVLSDGEGWVGKTDAEIESDYVLLRAKPRGEDGVGRFNYGMKAVGFFFRAKAAVYSTDGARSLKHTVDFKNVYAENAYTEDNFEIDRKTNCTLDALSNNAALYPLRDLFREFETRNPAKHHRRSCLTVMYLPGPGPYAHLRGAQLSLDGPPADELCRLAHKCGRRYAYTVRDKQKVSLAFMVGRAVLPVHFPSYDLLRVAKCEFPPAVRERRICQGTIKLYDLGRDLDGCPVYAAELCGSGRPPELFRCNPYACNPKRRGMYRMTPRDTQLLRNCVPKYVWSTYDMQLGADPKRGGSLQAWCARLERPRACDRSGVNLYVAGVCVAEGIAIKNTEPSHATDLHTGTAGKELFMVGAQPNKKVTELSPFIRKILQRHRTRVDAHFAALAAEVGEEAAGLKPPAVVAKSVSPKRAVAATSDLAWAEVAANLRAVLAGADAKPRNAIAPGSGLACRALLEMFGE